MVVDHDDARCALGDSEPEHLTRMHEAGVEDAARHLLRRHDTRLRVEREHVEHFRQLL